MEASELSKLTWQFLISSVTISLGALTIELLVLGWSKSSLNRLINKPSGSAKSDLWAFLLSLSKVYELIVLLASAGIFYFISSLFVHYLNLDLGAKIDNQWGLFTLLFIVTDLKHYLSHRFMHLNPFWELHAYHHSAEEFNMITTTRGHFTEAGFKYAFTGLFLAIFGSNSENFGSLAYIVFLVIIFRELYEYFLHSDVNWRLGFIGKYILIHPIAHKLHHSINPADYNKNYSTFFIWWDKIFGTYKEPSEAIVIGIEDNPYNKVNFFKGQWIGFKRFAKKIMS
jgi:sterol desaturase/sphingolipid hydroxylase (fatty acid hydroxylase superfamily)